MRILIAGVGNIFFGDDGFGGEVVRRLLLTTLPDGVHVEDFGIRSYDLAYAIMDGYDAVILVDAMPRGEAPGTLSLIEADPGEKGSPELINAHGLSPASVLQMVQNLGAKTGRMYVVGCEPAILEAEEIGLCETVQSVVPQAVDLIQDLVRDLLSHRSARRDFQPSLGKEVILP